MKNYLFLSVLLMFLIIMASCSKAESNTSETSVAETNETSESESETNDPIPKADYNGIIINILSRKDNINLFENFYAEDLTGEPINDAVYARNNLVADKLNISLKAMLDDDLLNTAKKNIMAGENAYDILEGSISYQINPLSQSGYLTDLRTVPNVDLSKPWWNQRYVSQMSIGNKLYSALGDINLCKTQSYITYFNKNLANELNLGNLYQTVWDGKWTLDLQYEMASKSTSDINGDGVMDENDKWGMIGEYYDLQLYYLGAGQSTITKDNEDYPCLSLNNDKTALILQNAYDFLNDRSVTFLAQNYSKLNDLYEGYIFPMFKDDRALFIFNSITNSYQYYRDMESDYGIIPVPKFDESQDTYYNSVSAGWTTAIAVPITVTNHEAIGSTLEALAYEGKQTVTAVYYDVLYANKATRDDESFKMVGYINDTLTFDAGFINDWGGINAMFDNIISSKEMNFASVYAKKEKAINTAIQQMIDEYKASNAE